MIKTLTLIDAICAIALFVTAFMGLHAKMEKRVSDWFVLTRLALIVAAITALATTLMFFHLVRSLRAPNGSVRCSNSTASRSRLRPTGRPCATRF